MNDDNKDQIPTENSEPIDSSEVPKELQEQPAAIAEPTQTYVPRSSGVANVKPSKWSKTKGFLNECLRVLRVTKKPNKEEFKTIVKISGIGIAVIGLLGFLISFIKEILF